MVWAGMLRLGNVEAYQSKPKNAGFDDQGPTCVLPKYMAISIKVEDGRATTWVLLTPFMLRSLQSRAP